MAPMTKLGSPHKFGTCRRGLGSKNVGVICQASKKLHRMIADFLKLRKLNFD